MTTLAISYPSKNQINPYKETQYTPYADKLNNCIEFTGSYLKNGQPKIRRRYTPSDIIVYGDLMRRSCGGKTPRPKISTIAERTNLSYGTVQRALEKFERNFVIMIKHTGRASRYFFVPLNDDGSPNQNSGEYQTAVALVSAKNVKADLAKKYIANNKETEIPKGISQSPPIERKPAPPDRGAELLSSVPAGCRIPIKKIKLWINTALKYYPKDAKWIMAKVFEADNPEKLFWKFYNQKSDDNKARQSLTKHRSPTAPPAKPQKQPAEQPKIKGHLPTLWNDFLYKLFQKDPDLAEKLIETPADDVLNCSEFREYLKNQKPPR